MNLYVPVNKLKELEKIGFRLGSDLINERLYQDEISVLGTSYKLPWYHKMYFFQEYDYEDENWIKNGSIGNPPLKYQTNEYGEYIARATISVTEDGRIICDVMNNDCSYHVEDEELDFIAETIFDMTSKGLINTKLEDK